MITFYMMSYTKYRKNHKIITCVRNNDKYPNVKIDHNIKI